MPTLKLATGFEHGTVAGLTTGAATFKLCDTSAGTPSVVSSGSIRSGTYCLELNPSSAIEYVGWTTAGTLGTATRLVASLYFMFPSALPSNDATLVYVTTTQSIDMIVNFRNSDDKIIIANHNGGEVVAGPVVVADTWYRLDFDLNVNLTTYQANWQVDGVAQTQWTGVTGVTGQITELTLGDRFNNNTMTCRYDDVVVSTTAADYPLGAHKVLLLKPDTGGTAAEIGTANATARFTANGTLDSTFNSANILAALSEVPPTIGASASGVHQRTSGNTNAIGIPMTTYTLGGGETVSGLRLLICGWAASGTANNVGCRSFNGTTELTLFTTADPAFDNSTTAPGWKCVMLDQAGFDTQTELDAMVIRYGYSTDVSPVPGAHAIYVELAVKESTGGGPPAFAAWGIPA